MKILVADDELEIRRVLRLTLEKSGYDVIEATDGAEAVELLRSDATVDLCIMDILMPRLSGISATAQIRRFSSVPVLFLTARSFESDKESAYASGGDDYLVKPFSSRELLMKVDALTRRYNSYGAKDATLINGIRLSGGVLVNVEARTVAKNGVAVELRDKEMDVLLYLVANRGRVISPDELYSAVWGEIPLPSSNNNVTVHILNLRRRLEDNPSQPKIIRTVWGRGYQIDEQA